MSYDVDALKAAGISDALIAKLHEHTISIPDFSFDTGIEERHVRADVRDVTNIVISVPSASSLSEFKISR